MRGHADVSTYEGPDSKRLVRPRQDRLVAGVCAGLGRRFGMSAWTARVLFVLVLMVLPGSQLVIYPILWILMPDEPVQQAWPTPPPAVDG